MWNDRFRIGDGEKIDIDSAEPVYRSYLKDCGIELDEETWEEQKAKFQIYYPTRLLSDIVFTPKEQPKQATSDYYFCTLDVKFPRTHH